MNAAIRHHQRPRRRRGRGHWIVGRLQGWAAARELAAFIAGYLLLLAAFGIVLAPDYLAAGVRAALQLLAGGAQ